MPDYAAQRANMVDSQVRANDVTDARIQSAMGEIARERFVPTAMRAVAYMEGCVPLGHDRALPDPRSFSKMAQLAAIGPTDRVLDVGTASGYGAAVLARLAKHVTALEEDADLVRIASETLAGVVNADVAAGRLTDGHPQGAPYDVIMVEGAVSTPPEPLLRQLAEGGRLVCVLQEEGQGHANLFVKSEGGISKRSVFDAALPVLPGFEKKPGFVF